VSPPQALTMEEFFRSVELDPFDVDGDFSNQVYYAEKRSTIHLADWGSLIVPGMEQTHCATSPGRGSSTQVHSRPASSPEGAKPPPKKRPFTSTPALANVAKDTKSRAELRARILLTGTSIPCGCRKPRGYFVDTHGAECGSHPYASPAI
jgi:hypothetical protein